MCVPSFPNINTDLCNQLGNVSECILTSGNSLWSIGSRTFSYERIIQRDLARTFPSVDMFKQEGGDGQQALERVLKAYSLYDSHVGYCQGLAFLVGPLLMNVSHFFKYTSKHTYWTF